MKTIRLSKKDRSTYTYSFTDGTSITLRPGDCSNGETITPELIEYLHKLDDKEVRNNIKNTRLPVAEWEKPIRKEWEESHEFESLPARTHVSIDAISVDEDGEMNDNEKGYLAEASLVVTEKTDERIARLREVVSLLTPSQQELYRRIVIEGEPAVSVAKEYGVDATAISHRMQRIKKRIAKLF